MTQRMHRQSLGLSQLLCLASGVVVLWSNSAAAVTEPASSDNPVQEVVDLPESAPPAVQAPVLPTSTPAAAETSGPEHPDNTEESENKESAGSGKSTAGEVKRGAAAKKTKPVTGLGPRWRLDLALASGSDFMPDHSFRSYSRRGRSAARTSTLIDLSFGVGEQRRFRLGPTLGWEFGRDRGDLYGASYYATRLENHDISLGLRAAITTVEGVDVYAELRGGLAVGRAWLSADGWTVDPEVRYAVGLGRASLGASLYLPRAWLPRRGGSHLSGGLSIEGAYGFRGNIEMQMQPYEEGDEDFNNPERKHVRPVPTQAPNLGTLQLHGLEWRVALFIRFM